MPRSPTRKSSTYKPARGRFAGRRFASKHAYRDALARSKGFKSLSAERRTYRSVGSRRALGMLSPVARQKRDDAIEVLRIMRRTSNSLRSSVAEFNQLHPDSRISPRTVAKYVRPALRKAPQGWRAKPYDRLLRVIRLPTKSGVVELEIRDSRSASKIGEYMNAVRTYLETGDASALRRFRHQSVTSGKVTYRFLTDPKSLDALGAAGVLEFESIYEQLGTT